MRNIDIYKTHLLQNVAYYLLSQGSPTSFPNPNTYCTYCSLKHKGILIPLVQRPEIRNKLLQVFCCSELLEAYLFRTSGGP